MNKIKLKAVKATQDRCCGCIFNYDYVDCIYASIFPCSSLKRKDGKNIIWIVQPDEQRTV